MARAVRALTGEERVDVDGMRIRRIVPGCFFTLIDGILPSINPRLVPPHRWVLLHPWMPSRLSHHAAF